MKGSILLYLCRREGPRKECVVGDELGDGDGEPSSLPRENPPNWQEPGSRLLTR